MLFSENKIRTLADAGMNEKAVVKELTAVGAARRRFLDLGIVRGTEIKPLFKSPFGDPVAFQIRGAVIALRLSDCKTIVITEN